jgi:very-short-patch-repair endonuclease
MTGSPKQRILTLAECARAGKRYGTSRAVRAIAAMQQGLIRRDQLAAAGAGRGMIDGRVRRGELVVARRGVYRVGPIAGAMAPEMAVILACRSPAWLSHDSAGYAQRLGNWPTRPTPIQITTRGVRPSLPRVRTHRTRSIADDEFVVLDGVPMTSAARTIVDLAGGLPPWETERLIGEAFALRRTNHAALRRLADRYPTRPGVPVIREILDAPRKPDRFRSPPERQLAALLRKAGLPRQQTNARIGTWEVDLLWPEQRVIVEFDAYSTHSGRDRFERDRRKDTELGLAGYLVIRVTGRQLADEPEAIVARVAAALALRAAG